MRCEVCGREIFGQPYYRIIEGGRMTVCSSCSSFGSGDWDPKKPKAKPRSRRTTSRPRPQSVIDAAERLELVENYGMLIKKTRQKKGMTVEDFAKKISEKESVIKKLEKEQLNPPTNLVKKLERGLGIKLLEVSTPTTAQVLTRPIGARTLGDMIKIKAPKDEEEEA